MKNLALSDVNLSITERNISQASTISQQIKQTLRTLVKPDIYYRDIEEAIITIIKQKRAIPIFPPNISENNITAHDCTYHNDLRKVKAHSVLKIDFGFITLHGIPVDTAICLLFGDHIVHTPIIEELVRVQKKAVGLIRDGMTTQEVISTLSLEITHPLISELMSHRINFDNYTKKLDLHVENFALPFDPTSSLLSRQKLLVELDRVYPKIGVDAKERYLDNRQFNFKQGQFFTIEPFVSLIPGKIIQGAIRLYKLDSGLVSNIKPSKNKIVQAYPLLKLADSNLGFQIEETYIILKGSLLKVS